MEFFTNMNWTVRIALVFTLLPIAPGIAGAQTASPPAGVTEAVSILSPIDNNFVAQANLGLPFEIDSGRVAEKKATKANIRDYAHLMVVTHIPVVDAFNNVLQQKHIAAPPNALLEGAYHTMIASLDADQGAALDRDYVQGQVDYQKGNAALFQYEIQYGTDPDLKEFARRTLSIIEDHLLRALTLAKSSEMRASSSCQSGNYLRIWAGSRESNANRRALFANEKRGSVMIFQWLTPSMRL
jgi:putative membrane protein